MSDRFTALEVLEIAIQMEQNGVKFYTLAAERCDDKAMGQFMSQLAEMEKSHAADFEQMKKDLTSAQDNGNIYDPDAEMSYYLKAIAAGAGWEGKAGPGVEFTGNETPKEILQMALAAEKNAIEYYTGIKEMVTSEDVRKKIGNIIREEMGHAGRLQKELGNMV